MGKAALTLSLGLLSWACGSVDETVSQGQLGGRDAGVPLPDAAGLPPTSSMDSGPAPLVPPYEPAQVTDAGSCADKLNITVRDFTEKHPDFEHDFNQLRGMVKTELGPDSKPVLAATERTKGSSGPDAFAQWYNDTDGVNMRVPVGISFNEPMPGVFVFESTAFFPIDGQGFGNGPSGFTVPVPGFEWIGGLSIPDHNFLFTTEVHTKFTYKGGERFTFTGDDDLWVFVNGKLGIDLGGMHGALTETLDMDARAAELGIVVGNTYPMDIFHAERHTSQSNFRIETTIDFSCIVNVPPIL